MYKKLLAGFVILLLLCGIAAWLTLPKILIPEAEKRLLAMGFDSVTLSDPGFSLHGVTFQNVVLQDNGQTILIENLALNWHGLDPRNLDTLHIQNLTLPLNLDTPSSPLPFTLNIGDSTTSKTAFDMPDIKIETVNLTPLYKGEVFSILGKNAEIIQRDDDYHFTMTVDMQDNKLPQLAKADGDIEISGTYKNTANYIVLLKLADISADLTGTTPVKASGINGTIRYAKAKKTTSPQLTSDLKADLINVDGAVFRGIQSHVENLSDGSYKIIAHTDKTAPTALNLNAVGNFETRELKGRFDIISSDLSTAPQDYPQLANPDLAGELTAEFDFAIKAPVTGPYNTPESWSGNISGPITLKDVKYNQINGINSKIDADYDFTAQTLKTDFDFKAATPALYASADLTFKNIDAEDKTIITGAIDNVVFDVFSLKSQNVYATYDRAQGQSAYDLKDATIIPRGAFAKYPNLNGRLRGTFTTPALGFNFSGVENGGRYDVQANGQYNTANKNLDITYKLLPKKSLSAADIVKFFPEFKSSIREFSGIIAVDGAGKLRNGTFTSRQDVKIDAQSITINTIEAVGIAGVIDVATTPAIKVDHEEIFIGGLDVGGMPLKEGVITFSYNSANNALDVHDMKWNLAEGLLTTSPFTFDTKTRNANMVLKAERIDLKQMFSYMPMEGLTASGQVSGEIPVSINQGKISVKQGYLEAVGTGDLQYNPEETPEFLKKDNPYINMVRDALKDYNYNILSLTVDGSSGERQQVILKASGSNPNFFDGRPVNLNLNVEGELEDLLKFNVGAFNLPERIKEKMKAFEE